jgi:hypothetical protein
MRTALAIKLLDPRRIARLGLGWLLVAGLLLGVAPHARGAQTDLLTFREPVDTVTEATGCPFAMTRRDRGTLVFTDRFVDGELVLENAVFTSWTITFTNTTNGRSIDVKRAYLEQFVLQEGGAFRTMSAGMIAGLVLPGVGVAAVNVGVILVTFDAGGNPTSVLVAGPHDGRINSFVCPAIA